MELYLLKYNNYYNRIIKKENTLSEYLQYQVGSSITNVSFNPSDGINTTQLINKSVTSEMGNYLICASGNNIISRWFIMEAKRERTGQYMLQLHRDMIVDKYNSIVNAPCFIEKATLTNDDPMILNSENMTFNQIKTSELLLKDKTNCAWIVGYYARTDGENLSTLSGSYTYSNIPDLIISGTIDNFEYSNNQTFYAELNDININILTQQTFIQGYAGYQCMINKNIARCGLLNSSNTSTLSVSQMIPNNQFYNSFNNSMQYNNITWEQLISQANTFINAKNNNEINDLLELNNKIIQTTDDNKLYRINIITSNTLLYENVTSGELYNSFNNILSNMPEITGSSNSDSYYMTSLDYPYHVPTYRVNIVDITAVQEESGSYNISSNRYKLKDAPYDMFCIPYGNINIKSTGDTRIPYNGVSINPYSSLACATGIAEKYGNTFLYDLQLLPYCPMESIIVQSDGTIDLKNNQLLYSVITKNNTTTGVIINCNVSSWTLNIPLENPLEITNKKIQNECDIYRLVSPNYNGQFEFNPAKNNGVDRFNVDCTYKPFNPYMHINPNFKSLYGQDFNDARGLIVQGDFSLPIVTDQFKQYELNNKNYQNIFDRGTRNLEINNKISNTQQLIGATGSALGTGIGAGLITGNPLVGVGAGIASALGGVADYELNKTSQAEALDYRQDLYGMNLANIKAMPDSIAKTSAFTYNNKIFPILEYYTCTDIEKNALTNKLYYNGMTVGRIGTIQQFIRNQPSYIKGKLIRLEDTDEDYHFVNEIANEINKGVFI